MFNARYYYSVQRIARVNSNLPIKENYEAISQPDTWNYEIRSEYSQIQQSNNGDKINTSKREIRQMPPSRGKSFDCQAQEDNKELNSSGDPHQHTAIKFQETTNTWERNLVLKRTWSQQTHENT